jgi:hypothetical protein
MKCASRSVTHVVTVVALAVIGVGHLGAQTGTLTLGAGAAPLSVVSADGTTRLREEGIIGAAMLRWHLGPLAVGAGYAEGAIGAVDSRRIFAEVSADASLALMPWLELRAGPVSRLIRQESVQERWLQWRGALVTRAPIGATPFTAHSALWGASGAVVGTRATGRGGSAGVAWHRGGTAILLEYGMDEMTASAGARRTVEQLRLQVEIGASRR